MVLSLVAMSQLILTRTPSHHPGSGLRAQHIAQPIRIGGISMVIILLVAMMTISVLSLIRLNAKATKGYVLNRLENEKQKLVTDGEVNDMLISKVRSLDYIEQTAVVASMRKPIGDDIVFAQGSTALASK